LPPAQPTTAINMKISNRLRLYTFMPLTFLNLYKNGHNLSFIAHGQKGSNF